jgi:hypothetical protein
MKASKEGGTWKNLVIGVFIIFVLLVLFWKPGVLLSPEASPYQTTFLLPNGDTLRLYGDSAIGGDTVPIPYFNGQGDIVKPDGTVINLDFNPVYNPGEDSPNSYNAGGDVGVSIVARPNSPEIIVDFVGGGVNNEGNSFDP